MGTRILVIGLGSIGMRHARLLKAHFPDVEIVALRSGTAAAGNALGIPEIRTWEEVDAGSFTAAIIANPTNLHIDTALECARRGLHLFVEKPIDCRLAGLDDLLDLVDERGLRTYLAYPLRHHAVVRALKSRLQGQSPLSVGMVSASYLPDWRPGRNHLDTHSARAESGGGVLLEMSHELDLAEHLFGPVEAIAGVLRRVDAVTVDAEDCADVLLTHGWGTTNIHLDMVSRWPRRTIEVDTAEGHLVADIRSQTITEMRHGDVVETSIPAEADDMYVAQLQYFLAGLSGAAMENDLRGASSLYRKIIALREEEGYGAADHHLRPGRIAGGQGQEHPASARQTPDRVHD